MLSCHGGRMETKFELRLNTQYDSSTLLSAFANGLAFEFLLDRVREELRSADIEKGDLFDGIGVIASNSADVSFGSVQEWINNKATAQNDLLAVVAVIDSRLAEMGKSMAGEFAQGIMSDMTEFLLKVNSITFGEDSVTIGSADISREYVDNVISQLSLVSENEFLIGLSSMKLNPIPLETKSYANTFIEDKLKKLNKLCDNLSNSLDNSFDKLQDTVVSVNKELYAISNDSITDGEKADNARKALRALNPYRRTIDKAEDTLIDAVEYSRQLTIHENKLKQADAEKLANTQAKIDESMTTSGKAQAERDMVSMRFMNDQYLAGINEAQLRLKKMKERVEEYRKKIDNVELAFKSAIPTESEMKKYSSIKHRLQDLENRLEIAGSQMQKDSASKEVLSLAKAGLSTLVEIFTEGKDLFMRNNLMSGIFASVSSLYNLGENEDKVLEKSQKKFISEKLEDYASRNASLNKDLTTFRKIGDEVIRDVAIVLGKKVSNDTLYEMAEIQELAINQSNQLLEMMRTNHSKQLEILDGILSVD